MGYNDRNGSTIARGFYLHKGGEVYFLEGEEKFTVEDHSGKCLDIKDFGKFAMELTWIKRPEKFVKFALSKFERNIKIPLKDLSSFL